MEFSTRATKTLKRLWQDPNYRALFHEKIIKGNKNHITNRTGKLKFLKICREVIKQRQIINEQYYEETRKALYPYGAATLWKTGLNKYFNGDYNLVFQEINKNHKVIQVETILSREDVYDLTIEKTHNFAFKSSSLFLISLLCLSISQL